jgi:hypothetical protein
LGNNLNISNQNTQRHNINMKRALTVMTLLAGAASVYSQGEVNMLDYGGTFTIQVFNVQAAGESTTPVSYGGFSGTETQGQGPNSALVNPGTTVYDTGSELGAGYSLQLLGAVGSGDALSTLTPQGSPITTWYTAGAGLPGFWNSGVNVAITGSSVGGTATVAIGAWNNEGGTVNSLAAAQAAGDPWGVSTTGNIASLGGAGGSPPGALPSTITSFSLATTTVVPEPSTVALGVIGASTFLMRLRRKQ